MIFLLMTETQSKGARAAVFAVYGLVLIYIFYIYVNIYSASNALSTTYVQSIKQKRRILHITGFS